MSDAVKDEPILLELRPKRAIVVACLFSSVSIVIAIGYLVQVSPPRFIPLLRFKSVENVSMDRMYGKTDNAYD